LKPFGMKYQFTVAPQYLASNSADALPFPKVQVDDDDYLGVLDRSTPQTRLQRPILERVFPTSPRHLPV
jgi:hypothetical protein